MKPLKQYAIYYLLEGVYIENPKANLLKYKKVKYKFKNEDPKLLRAKAVRRFNEIKEHILCKKGALSPFTSYSSNNCRTTLSFNEKYSDMNYSHISDIEKTELAFTLSFCIKDNFNNSEFIHKRYPIIAIGKKLPEIEGMLKLNLILEMYYYNLNNISVSSASLIKNFISNKTKSAMRGHMGGLLVNNADLNNSYINNLYFSTKKLVTILPTFQNNYYHFLEKEKLDFLFKGNKNLRQIKDIVFRLKRLVPFFKYTLNEDLSDAFLTCFFTQEQLKVSAEIQQLIKEKTNIEIVEVIKNCHKI